VALEALLELMLVPARLAAEVAAGEIARHPAALAATVARVLSGVALVPVVAVVALETTALAVTEAFREAAVSMVVAVVPAARTQTRTTPRALVLKASSSSHILRPARLSVHRRVVLQKRVLDRRLVPSLLSRQEPLGLLLIIR
jgi:hypothetical protein